MIDEVARATRRSGSAPITEDFSRFPDGGGALRDTRPPGSAHRREGNPWPPERGSHGWLDRDLAGSLLPHARPVDADTTTGDRCPGMRSRGGRASISGCSSTASTACPRASTRYPRDPGQARGPQGSDASGVSLAARAHLSTRAPPVSLQEGDCRALAARVSCGQDIAGDGAFSLGMIADYMDSLTTYGAGVLPEPVLGGRHGGAGALPRGRRGGHSVDRDRLLLRRSGPRGLRDRRHGSGRASTTSRWVAQSRTCA